MSEIPRKGKITCLLSMLLFFRFYNRMIESNKEQSFAIRCIVDGVSHSEPFVIFGPPGTGKTITVVESIKQVRFTV